MGELGEGFRGAARQPDGGLTPWRLRTAMILRHLLSVCGCLLIALGTVTAARAESVAVGVNVVNPQRLSPTDRQAVLDQLQAAGVHIIRAPLAPPWGGDDYGPAIDFIRRAYERGIKTDLIVELQYREGTQRRPAVKDLPTMWPSFPLSAADPARFRGVFERLFDQLEGMGITFAAFELGNEINWTGFNGEFPIPGEGRVFGAADLARDPEGRRISEGYRAYFQTLTVLKDIRDHSRFNRETPILSAGLADPGPAGPRPGSKADAVAIGASLQYLRSNGIDALVDAYGVHAYPWAETARGRLNQLEQDTLAECRRPEQGKPCWLTEWGLPADGRACPSSDAKRASLMREMLADFRQFLRQSRLRGLIYYAWDDDKYGIYRCGGVTESGRLALDTRAVGDD
jgi:hypothetical protein